MIRQKSEQDGEVPRRVSLPFGHRWHLEVSADTYLLLERGSVPTVAQTLPIQPLDPSAAGCPGVEIDLLALGEEWDSGLLLAFADAQQLLAALQGSGLVRAPGWAAGPEWLALDARPVAFQFRLTPPIRAALIMRLQTVLRDAVI